ncbi:nuclear transport factor 2 family protein [Vibrio fluvialis]|uniref:nuclear transport factor 2 family protein n=1 Tax=Vibrio fluvialis TaxID=676 RepID=UPI001EECBF11|nr:nuclear transport factor 2 family protein [Vibrio fluvialis]MCG6401245.1 nuclear transport factor 2 family protein [Vibrio fluvialis]
MELKHLTHAALLAVIEAEYVDEREVERCFASSYQQVADGTVLNLREFKEHLLTLKQLTQSMTVTVVAMAQQDEHAFSRHQVRVEKRTGERSVVEVIAHFQWRAGKIVRCDELSRVIDGDRSDRSLASVR